MNKSENILSHVMMAAVLLAAMAGCDSAVIVPGYDAPETAIDARVTLQQAAESDDPYTRSNALEAMAQVFGAEAGQRYVQALRDEHPAVRSAAAMAIGETRYEPAIDDLKAMAKETEPDKRVFCSVIYALHRLGDDEYTYALGELLFDREAQVRAQAAMVMGRIGNTSATGPLKAELTDEQDPKVQIQLLEALAMLGDSHARVRLEAYTKGYFLDLRLAAIPMLAQLDEQRSPIVLRRLFNNDPSPRVKAAAAAGLARWDIVESSTYDFCLLSVMEPRKIMLAAGGQQRQPSEAEESSLQRIAALGLGDMNRPEAVGAIKPLLQSPDGPVRVAAARSILKLLGDMGTGEEALPAEPEATTQPDAGTDVRPPLHTSGGKD